MYEHGSTGTVLRSVLKAIQQGPPCIIDQCLAPETCRSPCTRVHLQTLRCFYVKERKRRRELQRGDHPQLLPINSPPLLPLFFWLLQAVSVLPQVHQRSSCLPPSAQLEVNWRWGNPRKPLASGTWRIAETANGSKDNPCLQHHENRDDCISPRKGTTTTLPPILWLDGCQATASISAWLQPCHLLSHTHSTSFFPPIFGCSFSASALSGAICFSFVCFFLTNGKSRSQKKEQKLHWIAHDSMEFPNSLPGQTWTPENFGEHSGQFCVSGSAFYKAFLTS